MSGFLSICLGFGVALVVGYFMKLDKRVCSSFSFCSGIFNYGFFAFPVAAAIFGEQLIPKIIIFNLGVEIAVWTVGVYLLASDQFKWKRLINPPVVSIILAVFSSGIWWSINRTRLRLEYNFIAWSMCYSNRFAFDWWKLC